MREQIPNDLMEFFEPAECGECFVCRLVGVFREVRRVLRSDGTLWLNIGDSYMAAQGGRQSAAGLMPMGTKRTQNTPRKRDGIDNASWSSRDVTAKVLVGRSVGIKPKDLLGIPWLLAFALRADGWYLRSDVIWAKPNPMPESVTDRPTSAHEHVFLLSRSPRYFYDADAIREDSAPSAIARAGLIKMPSSKDQSYVDNGHWNGSPTNQPYGAGRNKRNVWEIATQPFSFDALPGGNAYRASPDCPKHGLLAVLERWQRAAGGAPQDHYQYRIDSSDARHALERLDEYAASSARHSSGSPPSAPSRTSESTTASKTQGPSSSASHPDGAQTTARTNCTPTPDETHSDSLDSPDHTDASIATANSTRSRRSAARSVPGDTDDAEPGARTQHTESTNAQPGPDGSDSPERSRTAGRSAHSCTCTKYTVDHFATFPPKLVEPCILAGSSPKVCGECGAPWERVVERDGADMAARYGRGEPARHGLNGAAASAASNVGGYSGNSRTLGWQSSCAHQDDTGHSVILDPFAGAGTTGLVALRHGRSFVGIELSPAYAEMARERIRSDAPLLNTVAEGWPGALPS